MKTRRKKLRQKGLQKHEKSLEGSRGEQIDVDAKARGSVESQEEVGGSV